MPVNINKINKTKYKSGSPEKYIIKFSQEYADTLQKSAKALDALSKSLSEYFSKIQESIEAVHKFLNSEKYIKAHQKIKASIELFLRFSEQLPEANRILINLGWWYLRDLYISESSHIVELHNQGKDKQIEKEIIAAFTKEVLLEKIDRWEKLQSLKRGRFRIVKDAVIAHIERKYTLSIPVLFAQVEGELREKLGLADGQIKYNKLRIKFKNELSKSSNDFDLLVSEGIINIVDTFLKSHGLSKTMKYRKISRHTVMHGLVTNYNKKSLSLKLILLFDFIQHDFDEIRS